MVYTTHLYNCEIQHRDPALALVRPSPELNDIQVQPTHKMRRINNRKSWSMAAGQADTTRLPTPDVSDGYAIHKQPGTVVLVVPLARPRTQNPHTTLP